MTQFEVTDLFAKLGFKCLEERVCEEVNDFGYYARFGNERHEVQFKNRDGKLEIFILEYANEVYTDKVISNLSLAVGKDLILTIAKQIEIIKEEYKGEIE